MSIDFTILCTRTPMGFLRKRGREVGWKRGKGQLGGLTLTQRGLEEGDDIPDDEWNDRVVTVIEASGRLDDDSYDTWVSWSEGCAEATQGAVYSAMAGEFTYIWAADPRPQERKWTEARLAAGDTDAIIARMDRPGGSRQTRYRIALEQEELRKVVLATLRRALPEVGATPEPATEAVVLTDPALLGALVNAMFDRHEYDRDIHELVLALADRPDVTDAVRVRANLIRDRRQRDADDRATVPATTQKLAALYEGYVAKDASAQRRHNRFIVYHRDELYPRLVAAIAEGWDPAPEVAAQVVRELEMNALTEEQRVQLEQLEPKGKLAQRIRDIARAFRDQAGKRAWDYSQQQYREYERYRDEPLVATPRRDRGMDVAMFRRLNDALWGPGRNRPRLPETVIMLICDRRFDDARIAYAAELGPNNAEEAVKDAIEYFAPAIP